ncbi:hypothetical protein D3C75_1205810 [compost metagenome]
MAVKKILRTPTRSASQPLAGNITATVNTYDTITECICSGLSPRLAAIEGRAVLTMVVSSDCMKKPKATIHNCHRTLEGNSVI